MERSEQLTLVWESELVTSGENRVELRARKPLSRLDSKQAARMLGCTEWTVRKLFRLGLISGWKPGAARKRRDGRESNAALVLDAESVLRYKASVSRKGAF
jgi:hypothetical protein